MNFPDSIPPFLGDQLSPKFIKKQRSKGVEFENLAVSLLQTEMRRRACCTWAGVIVFSPAVA